MKQPQAGRMPALHPLLLAPAPLPRGEGVPMWLIGTGEGLATAPLSPPQRGGELIPEVPS